MLNNYECLSFYYEKKICTVCVSDDIKIFVIKLKYVCSKQYFDISLNFYEVSCFPYFSLNISNNKI